ncbi:MAG: DNA-binding response regulator [Bacteroidetes bacterium]|nr:DNA-binding response regulator [Bacteroidota bacterium]
MIKVSIIEDNKHLSEGWKTVINLEDDMEIQHVFLRCEDALGIANVLEETNVLLLDIELPGMSGIKGVKKLLSDYPNLLVIMITVHEDVDHIYSALRNGAVGYLNKTTKPTDLLDAIRVAVNGGSPMSPNIARRVVQRFQSEKKDFDLDEKEIQILQSLASGSSYKMVAKQLYLSIDGVRYHIRKIYQKMDAKNRADAINKAYKNNLLDNQ